MTREEIVEKFICPGCVVGSDTECGSYKPGEDHQGCTSHILGTIILPAPGSIALGMPKGFNRPGYCSLEKRTHNQMVIRVWPNGEQPKWDLYNIPVWKLTQEGILFVRTVAPRIAAMYVDIVEDVSVECNATDVTKHYNEYD